MSHSPSLWCTRRLMVTVEGPQGKSVVPLSRPFARIGRQSGSDIVLDSPWVSKRSVYLHATEEGIFCIYMQPEETSTQRMGYWLGAGEPLLVGPYQISACLEGDPLGPAPALTPLDEWGSTPPPYPVFQVYSGKNLRDKRKFRARLNLIGRRHECALQIMGQQVSAFHGCLYWQDARLWYIDLASSNGSSVNGQSVDVAELHIGDRLLTGEFTLYFHRLSQRGTHSVASPGAPASASAGPPPEMLPAEFEDLPPEVDVDGALAPDEQPGADVADGSPVIALEPALAEAPLDLAPVQQTRHELAVLQKRVEELTQATSRAGEKAAAQLAQQTREALARERQRIAKELTQRAAEIAREKQALEAQWQSASRELATQVSQLRDEAQQLAAQRQAMEQSRLLWDAQRSELEAQLRAYAEQLGRLEQGSVHGLAAPAAMATGEMSLPMEHLAENRHSSVLTGRTAIVPLGGEPGGLVPRSHVVDAQVEPAGEPAAMPRLLEGSLSAEGPPAAAEPNGANGVQPPRMQRELSQTLAIKGRKTAAKGTQAFDAVTDRIAHREEDRQRTMMIVWIAAAAGAIALSAAIVLAAVIWGLNR